MKKETTKDAIDGVIILSPLKYLKHKAGTFFSSVMLRDIVIKRHSLRSITPEKQSPFYDMQEQELKVCISDMLHVIRLGFIWGLTDD